MEHTNKKKIAFTLISSLSCIFMLFNCKLFFRFFAKIQTSSLPGSLTKITSKMSRFFRENGKHGYLELGFDGKDRTWGKGVIKENREDTYYGNQRGCLLFVKDFLLQKKKKIDILYGLSNTSCVCIIKMKERCGCTCSQLAYQRGGAERRRTQKRRKDADS